MKIAVLSRNPRLYSTRRLVEAGEQRGHQVIVIDTLRAYMNIASHKPQIHYRGQPLEGFDAVIPRSPAPPGEAPHTPRGSPPRPCGNGWGGPRSSP